MSAEGAGRALCLDVRGLNVAYPGVAGPIEVVRDASFEVVEGQCLGIVGESGSGKSQSCLALMGLLPRQARVGGSIRFRGRELLADGAREARSLRGRELAMVFQDPISALTPHLRIGTQLGEVLRRHLGTNAAEARTRAALMLTHVGIDHPEQRLRQYPHQLSGGMRQRVMIAMACLCGPALLLADEPTTALDAAVQAQVIALLRSMRTELGMAMVLVTHDLALLSGLADRIVVMYAGRVVESASAAELFARPLHPYTAGLLACVPRWTDAPPSRFASIPGVPPGPGAVGGGCAFAPRCTRAAARCLQSRPELAPRADGRCVACHFPHA